MPPEAVALEGYTGYFADARRRGYSGVAIYTKRAPLAVTRTCGWEEMDAEGRFLQLDFGNLTIASLYAPSGISGAARQSLKLRFLDHLLGLLAALRARGGHHIVCGDFNVAHREIDIYDPVRNRGVTGFTPAERATFDAILASGWVDAFRAVNAEPRQYTWWSNWPQAWIRNLGWRIDYQIVSADLAPLVRAASIYKEQRFSDHAPVTIEYDVAL